MCWMGSVDSGRQRFVPRATGSSVHSRSDGAPGRSGWACGNAFRCARGVIDRSNRQHDWLPRGMYDGPSSFPTFHVSLFG